MLKQSDDPGASAAHNPHRQDAQCMECSMALHFRSCCQHVGHMLQVIVYLPACLLMYSSQYRVGPPRQRK